MPCLIPKGKYICTVRWTLLGAKDRFFSVIWAVKKQSFSGPNHQWKLSWKVPLSSRKRPASRELVILRSRSMTWPHCLIVDSAIFVGTRGLSLVIDLFLNRVSFFLSGCLSFFLYLCLLNFGNLFLSGSRPQSSPMLFWQPLRRGALERWVSSLRRWLKFDVANLMHWDMLCCNHEVEKNRWTLL